MRTPLAAPRFSVLIPTRDRPARLVHTLHALASLRPGTPPFEVIVVNDGSREALGAVVAPFRETLSLVLVEQDGAGPGAARNVAATLAKGAFLAFTDDDCEPAPDWLERLDARFQQTPQAAVGGRVVNATAENAYSTANAMLIEHLQTYFEERSTSNRFFTSNNLALPADRFRELGGFDAANPICGAEDREFCFRWTQNGFPLVFAPEAVVFHSHPLTLSGFCELHIRYGRGAVLYHKTRASMKQARIQLEPLSFYLNMPRSAFQRFRGAAAWRIAALLALSQGMHTLGFLLQSLFRWRRG